MDERKLCLITFSNNADHQNVVYSMFNALKDKADVYTVGIQNPKSSIAPHTERNFYFDCPLRPGIEKGTFRFSILREIARTIKKENIRYLYFESMHIWNAFLMLLCPQCVKIVAVHDVIPHDGNKAMTLCNYVTCKLATGAVLRNQKYKQTLADRYHIKEEKIQCFEPWRPFPKERPSVYSGKFLCFGRIRRYKGFDLLEQVIRQSPDVCYQIVGEADEESREMVDALKSYANVDMVDREVSDSEMEEFFTNADWVVLPYSSATQSGVITDAYRFSRPVIAFNVGAISEQVKDGKTGFLIPAGDPDQFAEKIRTVSRFTREETQVFAHNAYTFGYEKYAAEAVADRFLETVYSCNQK